MATGEQGGIDRRSALRTLGLMGLGVALCGCTSSQAKRASFSSGQTAQARCSVCGAPAVYWCPVRKAWFCEQHASRVSTSGGYRYICPR